MIINEILVGNLNDLFPIFKFSCYDKHGDKVNFNLKSSVQQNKFNLLRIFQSKFPRNFYNYKNLNNENLREFLLEINSLKHTFKIFQELQPTKLEIKINSFIIRFIFSNHHVLRSNLMFNYANSKREILESNGNGVGSVENVSQNLLMSLGYEYVFNVDKLRPYLGVELLLGVGKDEVYGSRTDSIIFVSDFNYSSKVASNNIGIGVFSGFDFVIYDGLYIGTEFGFQFLSTKSSRGEFKQMDASSTTAPEIVTSIPENKNSVFGSSGIGVIRVGWFF